MRIVLAAIDASPAARPVLDTAVGIAALVDATVEVVHVVEDGAPGPTVLASERGLRLRELTGEVEATLLDALHADEVVVGVVGARRMPVGPHPVGHVALHLLERAAKPLVVVPPDLPDTGGRSPHRLLVPLDGTEESSRPVTDILAPMIGGGAELVAVHVLTEVSAPPMVDHRGWGLQPWREEFLARYCPEASVLDLRTGPVGGRVLDTALDLGAEMIVLSWSQDTTPGHAMVVRDVLERSPVPVLLLPVEVLSGRPR